MEETPDCCEAWPKMLAAFYWFRFDEEPDYVAMPCIQTSDLWRVNYCPSCGAEVRGCIVRRDRVKTP
jgi:hypothetical protein